MKFNKWTLGLAAVGVVSLAGVVQAEERSNPVMTALASTQISGYVDTVAIWRPGNQNSQQALGGGWNVPGSVNGNPNLAAAGVGFDKADGFNLNVVGLTIEKPLDEAEWAAGYKVDLLFGPDAVNWNQSANVATGVGSSDFAIKQAYVTLRAPLGNGLDFKLGTFDSVVGYESFTSYKNPTWSRSYGWEIEPTQHTGALVSYKFNDIISVAAGIANTAQSGINVRGARPNGSLVSESEKTYMGAIALTAPESLGFLAGSTLYAGVVDGLNGVVSQTDTTWVYVGGTLNTPIECLKLGMAWDYRMTKDTPNVAAPAANESSYAQTLAGYLTWQAAEKLKVIGRIDWAKGTVGTWYPVNILEVNPKNQLLALTGTLDYSLWENVVTRLEFRWDRDLTDQHNGSGPFGFDDQNNYYLALNVIYKF